MLISLLLTNPIQFFASVIALVVGITVHEFSHALAASAQGDPTPSSQGRLSLNPLRHLDPFGTVFLLFAGFGWGRPVQIDPRYFKNPRVGSVLTGLAGPAANLVLVLVFGLLLRIVVSTGAGLESGLTLFFSALVVMNLILLVFNLIPIPPLDGSKALLAILPPSAQSFARWLVRTGPLLLFGLILFDALSPRSILGGIFGGLTELTFRLFLS